LDAAFGGTSLARALATYCLLESSAVDTYGPLLSILRGFRFTDLDLEFIEKDATIEVEHAAAAAKMVERAGLSSKERIELDDQTVLLERCWQVFWRDIWRSGKLAMS
jgi:hypothetical protein